MSTSGASATMQGMHPAHAVTNTADVSTAFRASTAWGDAVIEARGPLVTAVRPPMASAGGDSDIAALMPADDVRAPRSVRALAAALAAWFDGDAVELVTREELEAWLDAAAVDGFRRDVYLALHEVPRGVTITYGELATIAGSPGAARAVGSACARNPFLLVVPCHRVVHAGARNGDVGRYGAATGAEYKRRLLELEDAPLVRVPSR